jgi:hypothetical protein
LFFCQFLLLETKRNSILSRPKASSIILQATHFVKNNEVFTKGTYKVIEVFIGAEIHFEGFNRVKKT